MIIARLIVIAGAALGLLTAGGCGKPETGKAEAICVKGVDKAMAVQTAERVLTKMHFEIDKSDVNAGLVRTRPLSGAQFFELWRKDNVGMFNWSESNLQTLRRTAEVDIKEKAGQICIDCNVTIERLAMPERPIAGSEYAFAMYTKSDPAVQRMAISGEQWKQMAWIGLGSDERLEAKILAKIEKRMMQGH
jgi:hypothetical protein